MLRSRWCRSFQSCSVTSPLPPSIVPPSNIVTSVRVLVRAHSLTTTQIFDALGCALRARTAREASSAHRLRETRARASLSLLDEKSARGRHRVHRVAENLVKRLDATIDIDTSEQ
jgi:hypothetical protein